MFLIKPGKLIQLSGFILGLFQDRSSDLTDFFFKNGTHLFKFGTYLFKFGTHLFKFWDASFQVWDTSFRVWDTSFQVWDTSFQVVAVIALYIALQYTQGLDSLTFNIVYTEWYRCVQIYFYVDFFICCSITFLVLQQLKHTFLKTFKGTLLV